MPTTPAPPVSTSVTGAAFDGKILVIGLGGVSRCTLPLFFTALDIPTSRYTVIDFSETASLAADAAWVTEQGATFVKGRIEIETWTEQLASYVGDGDIIVDLAWNIGTLDVLQWCRDHGVRYVNASLELWDPYADAWSASPQVRTLYTRQMALRKLIASWGDNAGPTAVLDHGANPGLVSHFTKAALTDIATAVLADGPDDAVSDALASKSWNTLAQALGVKVIHISERDTQVSSRPKEVDEFVNSWSVEGFYEEGVAPAEMGWGTHERSLPAGAYVHEEGPRNQICLSRPGCRTWVRSWVPLGGDINGMVIRHGEAFSISDYLTVWDGDRAAYRPTVHYAYCPTDAAIVSLHELRMRDYDLQQNQRIMGDDIVSGRDELGVLLLGHAKNAWWYGSQLDIEETRALVPGQNATTLQVAAAVLGAVVWMIENPTEGVRLPDELPHERILEIAAPYLGPIASVQSDWTPLRSRVSPFKGFNGLPVPTEADVWQFETFLVQD